MIIRPTGFYEGIEDLVTPELFFDLMGWNDNKFGEIVIKYRISTFHYLLSVKLESFFGVSMYALSGGLISLGEIALAKRHGLCEGQVKTVETACAGSREAHSEALLMKALSGFNYVWNNKRAISAFKQLGMKYKCNKYIDKLPAICKDNTKVISQNELEILEELRSPCMRIAKTCLDNDMFKLKRDKVNIARNTRISSTIGLMNKELMLNERPNDTPSECYRGAYVTGLYILARWLYGDRLSGVDEIKLGEMIHDIRKIITDYDNCKT